MDDVPVPGGHVQALAQFLDGVVLRGGVRFRALGGGGLPVSTILRGGVRLRAPGARGGGGLPVSTILRGRGGFPVGHVLRGLIDGAVHHFLRGAVGLGGSALIEGARLGRFDVDGGGGESLVGDGAVEGIGPGGVLVAHGSSWRLARAGP